MGAAGGGAFLPHGRAGGRRGADGRAPDTGGGGGFEVEQARVHAGRAAQGVHALSMPAGLAEMTNCTVTMNSSFTVAARSDTHV